MEEMNKKPNDSQNKRQSSRKRPRLPKNQFRNDDDFNWGKVLRVVLSWSAIILAVFIVMMLFKTGEATEYELDYMLYAKLLDQSKIATATVKKSDLNNFEFHGTLRQTARRSL